MSNTCDLQLVQQRCLAKLLRLVNYVQCDHKLHKIVASIQGTGHLRTFHHLLVVTVISQCAEHLSLR
jgi:hypothetical protein